MKFILLVLTCLSMTNLSYANSLSINVNVGNKDHCLGISKQTILDKISAEMKKQIQEKLQEALRITEQSLGVQYHDLSSFYNNIAYDVIMQTIKDATFKNFTIEDKIIGEVTFAPGSLINKCEGNSLCADVPVFAIIPNENQTLSLSFRVVFDKLGYGSWKLSSSKKYDKLGRLVQDDGNICTLTYEHKNSPRFLGVDNPQTRQRIFDLNL